jgi:hypothetical protein
LFLNWEGETRCELSEDFVSADPIESLSIPIPIDFRSMLSIPELDFNMGKVELGCSFTERCSFGKELFAFSLNFKTVKDFGFMFVSNRSSFDSFRERVLARSSAIVLEAPPF